MCNTEKLHETTETGRMNHILTTSKPLKWSEINRNDLKPLSTAQMRPEQGKRAPKALHHVEQYG
jgi:hypothetical protein